jgi:hypothetical protein
MLNRPCLPQVIRDFRIETIFESASSASLREMPLADQRLSSCARELGEIELDIVLYCRDEGLAKQVGEVIAAMERLS